MNDANVVYVDLLQYGGRLSLSLSLAYSISISLSWKDVLSHNPCWEGSKHRDRLQEEPRLWLLPHGQGV